MNINPEWQFFSSFGLLMPVKIGEVELSRLSASRFGVLIKRIWGHFVTSLVLAFWVNNSSAAILINPGPVGTTFRGAQFDSADLNGVVANGQTIGVDFMFPTGIDAVYRFDPTISSRDLYGWVVILDYVGGTTVVVEPRVSGPVPLDSSGDLITPGPGVITFYGSSDIAYFMNYNMQFFPANLAGFTDVPYHGVRMNLRLPQFVETNAVITRGRFGFTVNGLGESTEIVSSVAVVPETSTTVGLMGLMVGGVFLRIRRRA